MKLSSVVSRVRSSAGDTDALQFTDAQLLEWINDGIRECATQNNLLQKRATNNTLAGQSAYSLPEDILKLYSVKYDGAKLKGYTMEEFDQRNSGDASGSPNCYYIWGGVLNVYPTPDVEKSLVVEYIYYPGDLTNNDYDKELPLPVGYHNRIVDYCLAQVAQQDDDINRYTAKMQEFMTGVSQLKDQPEYSEDVYPSISVSPRDMGHFYEEY